MSKTLIPISEDEYRDIEKAYEHMITTISSKVDNLDLVNMKMAFHLAEKAHSSQRRKSGEPYIFHPIAVAQICAEEIGLGPTAVISALLHDVVEDTPTTLEEISEKFGVKISKIVDGLTKLDSSYNAKSHQAENFKKVLSTLTKDVRVVLIKMADRLHNMRTLGSMPRHKQLKIASETEFIYAPLAHRLGLYAIKTEYQDLILKIKEPATYKGIAKKLQETKKQRNLYIKKFIEPLEERIKTLGFPFRIQGRPKAIYSILNKIKTKHVTFDEIYDLFAIRIIIDVPRKQEKSSCWMVYSVVTDIHQAIPERLKDWVATPKSNGYESLHSTVIGPEGKYVEVQIRSERMDDIAERGFAAHWKYKGVSSQPNVYDRWLQTVRELLENKNTDAVEFVLDFKTNLFHDEIYVYTPKGDMKVLPKGATALDFAFEIHTEVGYHCTAIKVNDKLVPLSHELDNGDRVSVVTSKNQKPSESWLKFVMTGKARSKIRSSMKEEQKKLGEYGKEALERKFKSMKLDFGKNRMDDEKNIDVLVKYFDFKTHVELFYNIAMENVIISDLQKKFDIIDNKITLKNEKPQTVAKSIPVTKKKKNAGEKLELFINGDAASNYKYTLAPCCNPVQGDDIFAYVTINDGYKIHRTTCPNATNLQASYGYRVLKAEWASKLDKSFEIELEIKGVDTGKGVIQQLTLKLSSALGLNIKSFYIDGNDGFFEGKIKLLVANTKQISEIITHLESMDEISKAVRLK